MGRPDGAGSAARHGLAQEDFDFLLGRGGMRNSVLSVGTRRTQREKLLAFVEANYSSLERAFVEMGSNETRVLSATDFVAELQRLGFDGDALLVWRDLDRDKNGSVSWLDFKKFVKNFRHDVGLERGGGSPTELKNLHLSEDGEVVRRKFHTFLEGRFTSAQQAWRSLDVDDSGSLAQNEFLKQLASLGFRGNAKALWKQMQPNANSELSWREFAVFVGDIKNENLRVSNNVAEARSTSVSLRTFLEGQFENADLVWNHLDVNRSGTVTKTEFLAGLDSLNFEGDAKLIWKHLDRDRNGSVSKAEFLAFLGGFEVEEPPSDQPSPPRSPKSPKYKAADSILSEFLSRNMVALLQAFHGMGDVLTAPEFDATLEALGYIGSRKELWQKLGLDTAGNTYIDRKLFVTFLTEQLGDYVKDARSDPQHAAKLCELARLFLEVNYETVTAAWEGFDPEASGVVTRSDFVAHLRKLDYRGDPDLVWDVLDQDRAESITEADFAIFLGTWNEPLEAWGAGEGLRAAALLKDPDTLARQQLQEFLPALQTLFRERGGVLSRYEFVKSLESWNNFSGDADRLWGLLVPKGANFVSWSDLLKYIGRGQMEEAQDIQHQQTAADAADAIDDLLGRRKDPAHRPLKASLLAALRCRQQVAAGPPQEDPLPQGARRNVRDFGRWLARYWMSSSKLDGGDVRDALTPARRAFDLPNLSQNQLASVRGLLVHLEWALKNDARITAEELLEVQSRVAKSRKNDEAVRAALNAKRGETMLSLGIDPFTGDPLDAEWPRVGEKEAEDFRMRPADRLLRLRKKLEEAHGSIAEAFRAMDLENRGYVSFDHFHAHLVRIRLSSVNAESSQRSCELFKYLDRDCDDLLSPDDVFEAIDLAVWQTEAAPELAAARLEQLADSRFVRELTATGDAKLRVTTFRRYLCHTYGSFAEGLKTMDPSGTGWVSRDIFARKLVAEGYFVTSKEALELFDTLDILEQQALPIRRLLLLEEWGSIGPTAYARAGTQQALPPRVGLGGVFADAFELEGRPAPRTKKYHRKQRSVPPNAELNIHERLWKLARTKPDEDQPRQLRKDRVHVMMDNDSPPRTRSRTKSPKGGASSPSPSSPPAGSETGPSPSSPSLATLAKLKAAAAMTGGSNNSTPFAVPTAGASARDRKEARRKRKEAGATGSAEPTAAVEGAADGG